ncbi:hypothetical protein H9P43_009095 [Blastocladiella emersonii ATCC 22665]|nr:hypothetical protein H9P43_009095 [Blastocladiella emersonii ATCC 22665]
MASSSTGWLSSGHPKPAPAPQRPVAASSYEDLRAHFPPLLSPPPPPPPAPPRNGRQRASPPPPAAAPATLAGPSAEFPPHPSDSLLGIPPTSRILSNNGGTAAGNGSAPIGAFNPLYVVPPATMARSPTPSLTLLPVRPAAAAAAPPRFWGERMRAAVVSRRAFAVLVALDLVCSVALFVPLAAAGPDPVTGKHPASVVDLAIVNFSRVVLLAAGMVTGRFVVSPLLVTLVQFPALSNSARHR